MNAALEDLVADLPELTPFIRRLDADADAGNPHAASLRGALVWIEQRAERDGHDINEKFSAIVKLLEPPHGFLHIPSIEQFVGWQLPDAVRALN